MYQVVTNITFPVIKGSSTKEGGSRHTSTRAVTKQDCHGIKPLVARLHFHALWDHIFAERPSR